MKRLVALGIVITLIIVTVGLGQTAIDPQDFAGEWYSSDEQNLYLFQEGIIYCPQNSIFISDATFISGAYTISKGSVFLFAVGVDGLEHEKEIFLIHSDDVSFLSDQKDGYGKIYFIRHHNS